jgi:hypothetical protein
MAGYTTALPVSAKREFLQAIHNFTQNTGHGFNIALGKVGPTGTYDSNTTNYSNLTDNADEAVGPGYVAGGFVWTPAQNITPAIAGVVAFTQWSINPSWVGATLSVLGCIIYNRSAGNRAVYVGNFGGPQQVTLGTLTLVQPVFDAGNALLRLQ